MQSTTIPAAHNPAGYTPQQVVDTINRLSGTANVASRYAVLDMQTLQTVSLPAPLQVQGAKITNDTTQPTHRSLTITMKQASGLNTLRHLIQPWFQFYNGNKSLLFEVPLGAFRYILPDELMLDSQNQMTITALDMTSRVAECPFANAYGIPAATNVVTAAQTLLMMDGNARSVANARQPISSPYSWPDPNNPGMAPSGSDDEGPNFPAARIHAAPTTLTTIGVTSYTRQNNKLDAANTLLDAISYYGVWLDEWANVQLQPKPYYNGQRPAPTWTYQTGPHSIIRPGVQRQSSNQADLCNCIGLECAPSGAPVIYSEQKNFSADSAVSIPNIGYTRRKNISNNQIATQAQADLACYIALVEAAMQTDTVQWSTAINPLHQSHDVIALNVLNKQGQPQITSTVYPYIETGWSMDLVSLVMTHSASRLVLP